MTEQEFQGRGLETYKKWFRDAEDTLSEARRLAHRDRDWYDNFDDTHWDDTQKRIIEGRGHPPTTSNRIKRKVNFLCGVEQKQRSDPMALARTPQHQEAANVATKVLTFIEDNTRFDKVASRCFKDLCIEGIEVCEVIVEERGGARSKLMGSTSFSPQRPTLEVAINKIDYDKFFYDPRSCEEDFSDARYLGYQDWFDLEDAVEMFPEAEGELHGTLDSSTHDEGFEDKPAAHWGNSERRRVRIACLYWKNGRGEWNYTYYTGGGVLKEGPSPYLDIDGMPECALIAQSAYVTRQNERYGPVRDMISPQRDFNYRKSMSIFHLKDNRIWSMPGVFNDNEQSPTKEMGKANGHLIANGVYGQEWGRIDKSEEVSINFQLMQEDKAEIDVQGPNAGLQGRGVEDQSGKAIALQQNAGLAEENTLFDSHNDWKLRVYRAMWARAKQFWTEERAIRVTDDQNATGFIMVNQPSGMPQIDPQTGQIAVDPQTGQPMMEMQNQMAEMDVDIVLELGPDMITLQHEEFEQLGRMAERGTPIQPDVMIQASQLRNKNDLIERVKQEATAQGQLAQAQETIQQLQKQLEQVGAQAQQQPPTAMDMAKIQDMQRKGDREDAKARADIRSKEANTAKTINEIMQPPQVA